MNMRDSCSLPMPPLPRTLLASSTLLALLTACAPPPRSEKQEAPPQVTLIGARLQVFRGETLVAQGRSAKVTYLRNNGDVVAREALVKLPSARDPQGAASSTARGIELRAATLTGNLGTAQSVGTGGVQLRSADGTVGQTASASFDGKAKRASGTEPVRLTGKGGWTMDAQAFEFLLPEERFAFLGEVVTKTTADAPSELAVPGAPR